MYISLKFINFYSECVYVTNHMEQTDVASLQCNYLYALLALSTAEFMTICGAISVILIGCVDTDLYLECVTLAIIERRKIVENAFEERLEEDSSKSKAL